MSAATLMAAVEQARFLAVHFRGYVARKHHCTQCEGALDQTTTREPKR